MPSHGPAGPAPPSTQRDGGDTIAAIATPPGRGAIAVVRVSGPHALEIARRIVRTRAPLAPQHATLADLHDARGTLLDRGIALSWRAPHSYTGEHMVELHVHGGPVLARDVLAALLAAGARLAAPGEFTRRAYENGKMDLAQAQAVCDVIAAETSAAARAAAANLTGALSAAIGAARSALFAQLEALAAAVDFPDDVADPPRGEMQAAIRRVRDGLATLRDGAELGRLIREGTSVAIVGPPNAGKSSLLNALLGEERALVSAIPGTTRDTIEEAIAIDGVLVRLIDTAGLRAHADQLEAAGMERTTRALAAAHVALVVLDGSRPIGDVERALLRETENRPRVIFCNKADLGDAGSRELAALAPIVGSVFDAATLTAVRAAVADAGWNGERLDLSRPHLSTAVELDAVNEALDALARAESTLDAGEPVDLCAVDLQRAVAALGHVSGAEAAEEVVDRIFARFCIGK